MSLGYVLETIPDINDGTYRQILFLIKAPIHKPYRLWWTYVLHAIVIVRIRAYLDSPDLCFLIGEPGLSALVDI